MSDSITPLEQTSSVPNPILTLSTQGSQAAVNAVDSPPRNLAETDQVLLASPITPIASLRSSPIPSSSVKGRSSKASSVRDNVLSDLQDVRYGRVDLLSPWFPEVDPKHPRSRNWRTWSSRQNVLLLSATLTSVLVTLANLIATIYVRSKYTPVRGVVPMYEGSCSLVRKVNTVLHVFINILSALLLGASNLCMQLLVAPTRSEIDAAHSKQRYLDIGVPSWRNLRNISTTRRTLWCILGLSSIPLHFVYNAAISSSLGCYGYAGAVVTESFLHGAAWGNASASYRQYFAWPDSEIWNGTEALITMQKSALDGHTFTNLSKEECVNLYTDLYGDRTNMMVVLEGGPTMSNSSLLEWVYRPASFENTNLGWLCFDGIDGGPFCSVTSRNTQSNFDHWYKFGRRVLYCLNEKRSGEHCRLNYAPVIFTTICCLSCLKSIGVALTMFYLNRKEKIPLCTVGDAISSFLEAPDPHTSRLGITDSASLNQIANWFATAKPTPWIIEKRKWYVSATKRRWIFSMSICGIAIVVSTYTMASGAKGTAFRLHVNSFWAAMQIGFGKAHPAAFTAYFLPRSGTRGFVANVIWANVWQIITSLLYLAYNGLLTCQLVSEEWAGYAENRKTLRVSHPKGIQRSTYFISMPIKYGLPLLLGNATLHWLVSQSTFLVSTTSYYPNNIEDISESFTTTGYSTSAAFASICFGLSMLILLFLNSFRNLPHGMPLVCTSSAAISAACHRPDADVDAHLLPVQWGVVAEQHGVLEGKHCCFTTDRHVRRPKEGELVMALPHRVQNNKTIKKQ